MPEPTNKALADNAAAFANTVNAANSMKGKVVSLANDVTVLKAKLAAGTDDPATIAALQDATNKLNQLADDMNATLASLG